MDKTIEELRAEVRIIAYDIVKRFYGNITQAFFNQDFSDEDADYFLSIFLDQTKDNCPECVGRGKYRYFDGGGSPDWKTCPKCQGTGKDPNSKWHPERLETKRGR